MKNQRIRWTPSTGLALLLGVAAVFAACGDDSPAGQAPVLIESDPGPKGDPSLVKDRVSGHQNQRVPITPKGKPTTIYRVQLDSLSAGMRIRGMASLTLTKCSKTDYEPVFRLATPCQGTKRYTYDPVWIETEFRLVPSGDGNGDHGHTLGPTGKARCTTVVHHCSVTQLDEAKLREATLKENPDLKWLVYRVRASSPKASSCRPVKAQNCEVLAVEAQKGSAMYAVQSTADLDRPKRLPSDRTRNVDSLPVLTEHGHKDKVRKVVYSVPLSSKDDIESIQGDQFEIQARLAVREELPLAPLVSGYLVMADSPKGIKGRFLASDSYTRTGNTGINCVGTCEYEGWAVATSILKCDIDAGRRFVNLVVDSARAAGQPGEKVSVLRRFGGLWVTHHHEAEISESSSPGRAAEAC